MRYRIVIGAGAARDLRKLPPETRPRVSAVLEALRDDPRSQGEKLAVEDRYRKRVGDYRIVFAVDDGTRDVWIDRVKHRRDAYRRR